MTAGRAGEDSDVLRSFERRGGPACVARVPARPERGRQALLGLTLTPPCRFNIFCTNILIVCPMFLPCNRWLQPTVVPRVFPATVLQSAVVCKDIRMIGQADLTCWHPLSHCTTFPAGWMEVCAVSRHTPQNGGQFPLFGW